MTTTKIGSQQLGTDSVGSTQLVSTAVTPGSYTSTNLTVDADGRITAASSGTAVPTVVRNEVPSGSINGSNATFTLAHTPSAGTECIYLNGMRLFPGAGNDYTISSATITMLVVPVTGDRLTADYQY